MGGEPDQVRWRGVRPVEGISGIWPSRNAVRVAESAGSTGLTVANVYTVPANKNLFISQAFLTSRLSADANSYSILYVVDELNADVYTICVHQYSIAGQQSTQQGFIPALEAGADYEVRLYNYNANLHCDALIFGWLEDA